MTIVSPELWKPQGVDDLEPRAWEALKENVRSVCVTAGAGAGKTEFLAQKATYLLQTGLCPQPKRILAISFKRDAARNLEERVGKRCPPHQAQRFESMTFDAFTKGLVDRFRRAIPSPYTPPPEYQISFPTSLQLREFIDAHGFRDVNASTLECEIKNQNLPFEDSRSKALRTYWNAQYHRVPAALSFAMLNRLAEWMLRENPLLRKALQETYRYVFLDEFQDTTGAQYQLLYTAFDGSTIVFTAVGDDKQRIMGWAGAMPDAFPRFTKEYNAREISLVSNWRSHEDLVRIQHVIAQRINPQAEKPVARGKREIDGNVAAIWEYKRSQDETAALSSWLAREIAAGVLPHEMAILVRSKADEVEDLLSGVFRQRGVSLRNVARNLGKITIQDLLSEGLTEVFITLLRLGAAIKDPEAWNRAQQFFQVLENVSPDDEIGQQRLQERLQSVVRFLRTEMEKMTPDADSARHLVAQAMNAIGEPALRRAFVAYQRDSDFERVLGGFLQLLVESAEASGDWPGALAEFEGLGQVALMTVHKSKGLEFHTMIFYGLDNQSWWSLEPRRAEELNSFFVAFTRARQRAFFTFSRERGEGVTWLERLLAPAGLKRIPGPTP